MLFTLIKYRLMMFLSVFRSGKKIGATLAFILLFILVAGSIASFCYGIYELAVADPAAGSVFLEGMIGMTYHGIFVFLCFSGLSLAVFTIFYSKDLELLLCLPIKWSSIFTYKVIEATALNARLSFLFLIPSLVILGVFHGSGVSYYIVILLVTIFMASIPGSLGIIVGALLSSRIPQGKLKGALTVAGAVLGIGIWAAVNRFAGQFSSQAPGVGEEATKMMSLAASPVFRWLPSGWAYEATMKTARGEWGPGLGYVVLLGICSTVLAYAALLVTFRHYADGVAEEIADPSSATRLELGIGGSPLIAHVKRDIILLVRESGVAVQSFIILAFLLLYPFIRPESNETAAGLVFSPVSAIFAVFFGGQFGSRLVPLEKLAFWQNLITPQGRLLTLLSKTIIGVIVTALIVCSVGVIHVLAGKAGNAWSPLLLVSFGWAGLAVGLSSGVFFGNFKWEHPKRVLAGTGNFVYIVASFVVTAILYIISVISARFLSPFLNPAVVSVVISMGFLTISFMISAARLANMEWNLGV